MVSLPTAFRPSHSLAEPRRVVLRRPSSPPEDNMHRTALRLALCAVGVLSVPAALSAQAYKTEKFNIGGEGSTDYLNVDPATGRVFISRSTHVMVVDGATGKVLGDISDTPRVHGIAFVPKHNRGFTTNAGDSTTTMFDLATLAVQKKIPAGIDGLDGI